jgi:hypothetical protein
MVNYVGELGLNIERMNRRVEFLNDRANWHQRRETPLDNACAATARRDAAVIALLLGRVGDGRILFRRAGQQWAALGLFAGYLLESFADPRQDFVEADAIGTFSRVDDDLAADALPGRRFSKGKPTQFEEASITSPRQLLNLYQAMRGGRQRTHRTQSFAARAEERLAASAAVMVGLTGLPIRSYLALFKSFGANEPTSRDRDMLLSVAIRREELLAAARTDQFHWLMMLKPAELVDLDLLALGLNALEAGPSSEEALFAPLMHRAVSARLPFLLARDLHRSGDHGSHTHE